MTGTTELPTRMPVMLKLVIGFYLLGFAIDVAPVSTTGVQGALIARIAITAVVVTLLVRGNESMRMFLRFFAIIGLIGGGVVLIQGFTLGLGNDASMLVLAMGSLAVVGNGITVWALGREDVQVWMATRKLAKLDGA